MAGPSVGNIEVTVDANTGKLKAQIVKAGTEAGRAGGKAIEEGLSDVDGRELVAKLRKIKAQAERAIAGIAVDIDVDDAGARAELRRLQAELRATQLTLFLRPEVNDPMLQAELEGMRLAVQAQLDAGDNPELEVQPVLDKQATAELVAGIHATLAAIHGVVEAEVDLDTREAIAKLKAAAAAVNAENARLRIGADLTELNRSLRAFLVEAEHRRVDIRFGADMREINRNLRQMEADAEGTRIEFQAALNDALYDAEVARIESAHHEVEFNAEMRLALHDAVAEAEIFRAREEADAIEVPVEPKLDRGAKAAVDSALLANFAEMGTKSSDSFLDSFSTRFQLIAGAVVLLTEPIAVLLESALGGALSVLSSGFSALAGAAGAAAPIIGSIVPMVGAIAVGAIGISDAFDAVTDEFRAATVEGRAFNFAAEDIVEAMALLGPAATEATVAFAQMLPALVSIQQAVSEHLLAGFSEELDRLSVTVLPQVTDVLMSAADALNSFGRQLADVATETDFAGLFEGIRPAIDDIQRGLVNMARAVEPFFKAATPAARELAESFRLATRSLTDMITVGARTGALTDFLLAGVESMRDWADLAGEVTEALAELFRIGTSEGDTLVQMLTGVVETFNEWLDSAEGETAVQEFLSTSTELLRDLTPLLEGAKGFFDQLVTPGAVDRFGNLTQAIGDLLPFLGQLFEIVGRTNLLQTLIDGLNLMADALQPAIPAFQQLADTIAVALADALVQVGDSLPELVDSIIHLTEVLTPVISDVIGNIAGSFVILAEVAGELLEVFADLPRPVQELLLTFAGLNAIFGDLISSIVRTSASLATFAIAHPWITGLAVAVGLLGTAFLSSSQNAEQHEATILALADAYGALLANDPTPFIAEFNRELDKEQIKTREAFQTLGLHVVNFGLDVQRGLTTAEEELATMLERLGPAGRDIAAKLRAGTLSVREFEQAFKQAAKLGTTSFMPRDLKAVAGELDKVGIGLHTTAEMSDFMADAVDRATESIAAHRITSQELVPEVEASATSMMDAGEAASFFEQRMATLGSSTENVNEAANGFEQRLAGIGDGLDEVADRARGAALAMRLTDEIDTWRAIDDAMFGAIDPAEELVLAFEGIKTAASEGDAAVKAFEDTVAAFRDPAVKAAQAARDYQKNLDDLAEALTGGTAAQQEREKASEAQADLDKILAKNASDRTEEENARIPLLQEQVAWSNMVAAAMEAEAKALDINTEAGRQAHATMQEMADAAFVLAAETTRKTGSIEQSAVVLAQYAIDIANVARQAGATDEQIQNMLTTFGLTPETVVTTFLAENVTETEAQVLQLDENMNGIPDSIETLISMPGITQAQIDALLLDQNLDGIPDSVQVDTSTPGLVEAQTGLGVFGATATNVDGQTIAVDTSMPGLDESITGIGILGEDAAEVDSQSVDVPVSVSGADAALTKLTNLGERMQEINGKTVTVTVVSRVPQILAEGGIAGPAGAVAGEAGPEFATRHGVTTLLAQPTFVPAGTQVTSTEETNRLLMEALKDGSILGPRTIINQYFTLTSADPAAVSVQAMNRAATLAAV